MEAKTSWGILFAVPFDVPARKARQALLILRRGRAGLLVRAAPSAGCVEPVRKWFRRLAESPLRRSCPVVSTRRISICALPSDGRSVGCLWGCTFSESMVLCVQAKSVNRNRIVSCNGTFEGGPKVHLASTNAKQGGKRSKEASFSRSLLPGSARI